MSDDRMHWYARPVFFVASCEESLAFYERLGFTASWKHSEEGTQIALQINRDGAEIILNRLPERAGGGRLFVSLELGETARVVAELAAAGIAAEDALWGMPVKAVRDPDGNDLLFYDDELGAA